MRRTFQEPLALLALATMALVLLNAPQIEAQSMPTLTGLLDYPAIYADSEPGVAAQVLKVHERASNGTRVVAQLDRKGIRLADAGEYFCTWTRDLDVSKAATACVFTESGYEIPALAVFGADGQWYRIALDDSHFGWVQQAAGYHSLADLLASSERLTYLTPAWDGRLYDAPGKGATLVLPRERRRSRNDPAQTDTVPYRALDHTMVAGRLWIKVEILDEVCGERDPHVLYTGWVPAQSPSGELLMWFHSRGC